MDIISAELIAVIVTLIVGFGGISYQIGRRANDLDELKLTVKDTVVGLQSHESECIGREKEIQSKLAEGSVKMAVLETHSQAVRKDISEIKNFLIKPNRKSDE